MKQKKQLFVAFFLFSSLLTNEIIIKIFYKENYILNFQKTILKNFPKNFCLEKNIQK